MMKRLVLAAVIAAVPSCNFAVKHPAVTAGVVGGTIGLGTCELASREHKACFAVAGGAGLFLGLVAAAALWLGTEDAEPAAPPALEGAEPIAAPATIDPPASDPATPATATAPPPAPAAPAVIPEYLKRPPELSARSGSSIVRAPAEDQAVAASYATSPVRGPISGGKQITILTARPTYQVGEEVRVIHVLEAPQPGHSIYVMGPKAIHGEYVDGVERTPKRAGPAVYDGAVVQSPGVDFNYEVTTYTFDTPGPHRIQWRDGGLASNVLELEIVANGPATKSPAP